MLLSILLWIFFNPVDKDTTNRLSAEHTTVVYPQLLPDKELKALLEDIDHQKVLYSDSLIRVLWHHYNYYHLIRSIKKCQILEKIHATSILAKDTININRSFHTLIKLNDSASNTCKSVHIVNHAYYLISHLKYREGLSWLKKAYQLVEDGVSDQKYLGGVCLLLSHCNYILEDTVNAYKYSLKALPLLKEKKDTSGIIKSHLDLAVLYTNGAQARNHFDSAVLYAKNNAFYEIMVYNEYLTSAIREKRETEVAELMPIYKNLLYKHPFDERLEAFHTNMMVYYYYYIKKDKPELHRHISKLLGLFSHHPLYFLDYSVYQNSALVYKYLDKPDSAYHYLKKYVQAKRSMQGELNKNDLNTLQHNYERLQQQKQINETNLRLSFLNYEAQKKKTIILFSICILLALLLLTYMFYILNRKKIQKLAQKLQLESQQLLYNNISALIGGEDQERQRVAEELHDNVGSMLAMAHFSLPAVSGSNDGSYAMLKQNLKKLGDTVRDFSHKLHPQLLLKCNLPEGIARIQQMYSSHPVPIQYTHYGEIPSLPTEIHLNIYRIAQIILDQLVFCPSVADIAITSLEQNQEVHLNFNWKFESNASYQWEALLFEQTTLRHRMQQTQAHYDWDSYDQQVVLFIALPLFLK